MIELLMNLREVEESRRGVLKYSGFSAGTQEKADPSGRAV
jgi:hypothetical protein